MPSGNPNANNTSSEEHVAIDKELLFRSSKLLTQNHLYDLIMQLPSFVAVLRGPQHVFELCNPQYQKLVGVKRKLIGRPVSEALPEVVEQGFTDLLNQVYQTGVPYQGDETLVYLDKKGDGKLQKAYLNFVYQPFRNDNDEILGILVHGTEVSHHVEARAIVRESENKYKSIFNLMDQGFCIIDMVYDHNDTPIDYRFDEINPMFSSQTGIVDGLGKTAREVIPNLEKKWFDIYGKVSLTGKPTRFVEGSEEMGRWFEVYAFRLDNKPKGRVALLFTEISEREKSKMALEASELRAKEELEAMKRLHEIVARLLLCTTLQSALEEVLNASIEIGRARKGHVQLYDPHSNQLKIIVQNGFDEAFLKHFSAVMENDGSAPSRAMDGKHIVIEDVFADEDYEAHRNIAQTNGYRSVQSIPLLSRKGNLLGVLNTYYEEIHTPSEREIRILDLYARQAADFIEFLKNGEEIKSNERRFKTYIEALPQMAFIANSQGDIVYFNQRWYDYVGDGKDTEGWGWKDKPIHHPEDLQRTIDRWNASLSSGNSYEIEYRLRRHDGEYRWHLGRAEPIRDEDGNIEMWLGTNTDIHTQKLAEEVLRKSQAYYKTMTDNTPVMTWITNPKGECTFLNKQWYDYTGQTEESGLGFGWLKAVHPDDSNKSAQIFLKANEQQVEFSLEYRLKDSNGNYQWHRYRASKV